MNITNSETRRRLMQWAEALAQLVEARDPSAATEIRQALGTFSEHRFVVTVLGKAKRGKSTLVNSLLGRRDDLLAPIDQLPASNVLSRFQRGDSLTAKVYFRPVSAGAPAAVQTVTPAQIREFVTEEGNPENRKHVEAVEVAGPFEGFDDDLTLIDTPGAGSIHAYHDEIVRAVIPQSDAVIFLVTARMPLDADELELLRHIRSVDVQKLLFVINRVDQSTDEELVQAEDHNRALLQKVGIVVDRLHRVSAKRAFEGALASSGLPDLAAEIRELLQNCKSATLDERLVSRVRLQVVPLLQGLDAEIALLGQSAGERQRLQAELVQQRGVLSRERGRIERQFEQTWNRAVDAMALAVKNERGSVEQRLMEQINAVSALGVKQFSQEFPQRLVAEVEAAVQPHAVELERSLQAACRELEAQYPSVDVAQLGAVGAVQARGSLMPSMIYGTTLAAGGGAALAAAQAAAASAFQVVTTQSLAGAGLSWLLGVEVPLLTSTVVPTALPAWAVVAGPVGWTLLGLGALAIPFGWSLSRAKMKEQLREQAAAQIGQVVQFLLEDRLPYIRQSGPAILEEYRQRTDRQLAELEAAITRAETAVDPTLERSRLTELHTQLSNGLEAPGVAG